MVRIKPAMLGKVSVKLKAESTLNMKYKLRICAIVALKPALL
jgi:hypothetical protein